MAKRCKEMDQVIDKIAQHLDSQDTDPRRWWAARRERNGEIVDLYTKGIQMHFY